MPGIKVSGFRGKAPKVSPELLPDQSAQVARNCKLYSGDLIPFPEPVVDSNTGFTGVTSGTIFPLRNPTTDALVWMTWQNEVNVATPSFQDNADEQRFYYTGDGVPKVSTYSLATEIGPPYPDNYYELGLPLPETEISVSAASFSNKSVSSISRDAGGVATYNTSTAHELRTGMFVSLTGFTHLAGTYSRAGTTVTVTINNHGIPNASTVSLDFTSGTATDGVYTVTNATTNTFDVVDSQTGATSGDVRLDMRSFNATSAEVTVVDTDTFTVFAPGFQISTLSVSAGQVELGGDRVLRQYVYTWYTPWGEESIGSEPTEFLEAREGQVITVTNIPQVAPSLPVKNFVRGVRIYRTLASEVEADFFLLKTLWFPTATATVSRSMNVSTVKLLYPHNFIEDDRFKLVGCTNTSFNITGGVVTEIVDDYTFKYNQAGSDLSETADTTGILYHDVAEDNDSTARYWGDTSYDFTDDFDARYLSIILNSDEYDAPPEDLRGLKTIQNNILVGFVNNQIYFSEPDFPHAWPTKYIKAVDRNIVAIEPISGAGALVLTEGYPYLISGNDPDIMSIQRLDALYPCASSRGVVSMSYGILWPTNEGLALYSSGTMPRLVTQQIYEQDTWSNNYSPSTISAVYYGDAYFASHSTGSFIFTFEPAQNQGFFVDCDQTFTAAHNDTITNRLYFSTGTSGDIYEWDNIEQPNQVSSWKSKVFVLKDYTNWGAARVVADYNNNQDLWEDSSVAWESWSDTWDQSSEVTFKLYANKELKFTKTLENSETFRLPTGYRTDTYEFLVDSDVRIRSVHLAETPLGLKAV